MKGKGVFVLFLLLFSCLENDVGITAYDQWLKDVQTIDAYVTSNNISVIKDAGSGISIEITELGTAGLPPNRGNNLKINYTGKLLSNGSTFDQGTTYLKLGEFIVGWQIGLSMLPAGSKATLYIPSYYGYGSGGSSSIPPNSNLIFNVDLESVSNTSGQNTTFTSDTSAIIDFLEDNVITAMKYDSGIWYSLLEEGTGLTPTSIYDQVKIRYTVKQLSVAGTVYFDNLLVEPSATFSSRLVNFPQGAMIGLQLLKEGDKAVFYVPSVLGFGAQGLFNETVSIPGNTNLIFEIELLEVIQ